MNKKSLEALIKSGSLDHFGERNQLLYNMDKLLVFIKNINAEADSKQANLFGEMASIAVLPKLNLDPTDAAADKQKLNWEKEYLGLYVSAHPLTEYSDQLRGRTVPIKELLQGNRFGDKVMQVAGVIGKIKKIITKKGEAMLFVRIEDMTNGIEVLVFPRTLKDDPDIWQEDKVIMMNCRLSDKEGENKLICERAKEIDPKNMALIFRELEKLSSAKSFYRSSFSKKEPGGNEEFLIAGNAYVLLPAVVDPAISRKLKEIFNRFPGKFKVMILLKNNGSYKKIMTNYVVSGSPELKTAVEEVLGKNTFKIEAYDSF